MTNLRVLVVDDDRVILELMRNYFRRRGDQCVTASNGADALDFLVQDRFDLLLTDLNMPGMDGLELVKRAKEIQPMTVCMLMSGLGTRGDILTALKIGVFDFVDKPIPSLAEFTMIVDRAAESGRLTRERDMLLDNLKQQNSMLEFSLSQLKDAFLQLRQQEEALESDLLKAQRVQQKFLPAGFPFDETLDVFGYFSPCQHLGGDFFGSLPLGEGRQGLFLVDVAGHGVSAAMVTITLRELMRAALRRSSAGNVFISPSETLAYLNEALLEEAFDPPIFVTMVYAVIDSATGKVELAEAGHPPPVHIGAKSDTLSAESRGPVLGLEPRAAADFPTSTFVLGRGESLVLYSDGLTEARDKSEKEFSVETLRRTVAPLLGCTAAMIGEKIEGAVREHLGSLTAEDDLTFVVATRLKAPRAATGVGDSASGPYLVPNSVRMVAPVKSQQPRASSRSRLRAGWRGRECILRIIGLGTWQLAPAFREALKRAEMGSATALRIDLSECESMDSTFLGLLVLTPAAILHQPRRRVVELLRELGVLGRVNISHEPCVQPQGEMELSPNKSKDACSELILSAHEALMEASESNRARFEAVVASLRAKEKAGEEDVPVPSQTAAT